MKNAHLADFHGDFKVIEFMKKRQMAEIHNDFIIVKKGQMSESLQN